MPVDVLDFAARALRSNSSFDPEMQRQGDLSRSENRSPRSGQQVHAGQLRRYDFFLTVVVMSKPGWLQSARSDDATHAIDSKRSVVRQKAEIQRSKLGGSPCCRFHLDRGLGASKAKVRGNSFGHCGGRQLNANASSA